jgi:tetratricopeptide (TPR) repeat protein
LLALVTMAVYWPATQCDFINFDDDLYVTANVHVQGGLTLESIKWAFLNSVASNWHPVAMLSHMLDCQFYSLNPWGHHLTSMLIHTLNSILVYALLQQLTSARWRSFFVAALFAVHPLHVESVTWIAERKDVLSGFFGLLTLIFYTHYSRKQGVVESNALNAPPFHRFATLNYPLALLFFGLGLMSKPMLVTLPFVMLLLDYWPLRRFKPGRVWFLVMDKIPFFVLAAVSSYVALLVQEHAGAAAATADLPWSARGENALISYCRYLGKLLWPSNLAVFYPHPGHWPQVEVLLAGLFLVAVSIFIFSQRRRYPFALVGWFWFCGTLVPVIGLVQVGAQAMADRYAYLPSIGAAILVVWGAYELAARRRNYLTVLLSTGFVAIIFCIRLTRQQIGYWENSETLYRHALAVTTNNYTAHYNLAVTLDKENKTDEAVVHYQEALRLNPDAPSVHKNIGNIFFKKGQFDEAIGQYQEALRLKPGDADTFYDLGTAFFMKGQTSEAIGEFQMVIQLKPDHADAHNNLGNALAKNGQIDAAISEYQQAIRLQPDRASFHNNLGIAFSRKGQTDSATSEYQQAIQLKPDYIEAQNNLARLLGHAPTGDSTMPKK